MKNLLFILALILMAQNALLLQDDYQEDFDNLLDSGFESTNDDITVEVSNEEDSANIDVQFDQEDELTEQFLSEQTADNVEDIVNDIINDSGEVTTEDIQASVDAEINQIVDAVAPVQSEDECSLDEISLPQKERIVEYIEETTPGEEVCVKPERLPEVYGPFYARPPTPKAYTPLPKHDVQYITPDYETRVERTFEDSVEEKLDEKISEIVDMQNVLVEKTKKAKKKQQYLKKIIEVEYKKGKKKNTKYIDELKEEYEKSAKRTEELEVEKEKTESIIKEALDETNNVANTKHEATQLEKLIEQSLDETRTIENSALHHIVEIKKMSKESESRLDQLCEEEVHEVHRRDELNSIIKSVQERKKQVIELLKKKLEGLKEETKFENNARDRLCAERKALITNEGNLQEIDNEDKRTEIRTQEREVEKVQTVQRLENTTTETSDESAKLEISKKYLSASERRLSQIKKKQRMIEKLLTQEKVTVKKDINRRKAVIVDIKDTTKRRKAIQEEMKKQHISTSEVHDERQESVDQIQTMLDQLKIEESKSTTFEESTLEQSSIDLSIEAQSHVISEAESHDESFNSITELHHESKEELIEELSDTLKVMVEEDQRKDIIQEVVQEEVNPDAKCEEIRTNLEIAAKVETELEPVA
jgi:hypothetical protein